MTREYRHIKQYENEILQLKSEGLTKCGKTYGYRRVHIWLHYYTVNDKAR